LKNRDETLEAKCPFLLENVPNTRANVSLQKEDSFSDENSLYANSSVWNYHDHWDDNVKSVASPDWSIPLEDKKWIRLCGMCDKRFTHADFDESH